MSQNQNNEMTTEAALIHNINCWKEDIKSIAAKIEKLKGQKEALEGTVECLEIILEEAKNPIK